MQTKLTLQVEIDRSTPEDVNRDMKELIRQIEAVVKTATGHGTKVHMEAFNLDVPGKTHPIRTAMCPDCGTIIFTPHGAAAREWRNGVSHDYGFCPNCERRVEIDHW